MNEMDKADNNILKLHVVYERYNNAHMYMYSKYCLSLHSSIMLDKTITNVVRNICFCVLLED